MVIRFKSRINDIGNKDNPSAGITVPKFLIKEGKVNTSKVYMVSLKEVKENER